MKTLLPKIILLFLFLAGSGSLMADNDLPTPAANIETIPGGAWVIAMDNTLQGSSGIMNLKAYGLVAKLLWNDVHVKWAIRAGKGKDDTDFVANATQNIPTVGTASGKSFLAGPFIIMPSDTAKARGLINSYNSPLAAASKVKVYKINTAVDVDIRYTLVHKPRIAIYNDGGNYSIHTNYLSDAGFDAAYSDTLNSGSIMDSLSCYTFASTPHWKVTTYKHADSLRLINLKSFLRSGGNFLAQCEGAEAIENFGTAHFISTVGINNLSTGVSTLEYKNTDMPIMQMNGNFVPQGGSLQNWNKGAAGSWIYPRYAPIYFIKTISGVPDTVSVLNVSKFSANGNLGGTLIYLGGHDYSKTSAIGDINGERIYLNAVLMPSKLWETSPLCSTTLPVELVQFEVMPMENTVRLDWITASEFNNRRFDIERSEDGISFVKIGEIAGAGNSKGWRNYSFLDLNPLPGVLYYYRLKQVDLSGRSTDSRIRKAMIPIADKVVISEFMPNVSGRSSLIKVNSSEPLELSVKIFTTNGVFVKEKKYPVVQGESVLTLEMSSLPKGSYIVQLYAAGVGEIRKLIKIE